MRTGIYKITNTVNKRFYIGSAVNYQSRKVKHILELKKNKHANSKLQRFINKYGIECLVFELLEECEKEQLLIREQHYLDTLNAVKKGFNILPTAGNWLGRKHTKATKLKQSNAKKGTKVCVGRVLSENTRDKIRQKAIGRKQSLETVAKRVSKNTGKKRTKEAILKTAISHSKLTDIQVIEIRNLLKKKVNQHVIAKKYGVCQRNISRINQGISYQHVKQTVIKDEQLTLF